VSARQRISAAAGVHAASLGAMTALWPLLLLDLLVGTWIHFHLPTLMQWLATNVVLLGGFGLVWAFLPDETVKDLKARVATGLQSRRLTIALWGLTAAFFVFTLFVSTVRVTSDALAAPVTVYRVDAPGGSADTSVHPVDSVRLAKSHDAGSFFVLTTPMGRTLRLRTSPTAEAQPVRVRSWTPVTLMVPDDFAAPFTVAALLAPNFFVNTPGAGTVRIQVRAGGAGGELVVDDTIREFKGLLLAASEPAAPDSSTRQRWLLAASKSLGVDTAEVVPLVHDWMATKWVRTTRPLRAGERLVLTIINAAGDTIARDTCHLTQRVSDVIIRRT
jgi:hypothetical protein